MHRVKELRQRLGLSQEDLSKITNIPRTTISAIESEKAVPSVDYALRLAKALRCTVEELFGKEEFVPLLGFKKGLFVSYQVGEKRVLFPVDLSKVEECPEGYFKEGKVEWFNRQTLPTYTFAGCDPSFKLLSKALREEGIRLLVVNLPSMKALELLKDGFLHMAGVHMGSFEENIRLAKSFLGKGYKAVKLFSWEEGIAVREKPSLQELKGKLWLAREEGSGARKVFEELRKDMAIENFRVVSGGHEKIAFSLREGFGDAGITTKAYALEYGLSFLGIKWEDYCLCYRADLEEDRNFLRVLDFLRGKRHTRLISYLPGYEKKSLEEVLL